jgi:hypothetical protein
MVIDQKPGPPDWTPEELSLLREHYPRGGVPAVMQYVKNRSYDAIRSQARKRGVKYQGDRRGGIPVIRWTSEMREQIVEYRLAGLSKIEIAERVGCTTQALNTIMSRHGIGTRIAERYRPPSAFTRVRACMCCQTRFESTHRGNHICPRCTREIDGMAA